MKKNLFFIFIIISSIALAQESNALFTSTDSLTTSPTTCKHQIGIGLSKFVNAAFPSDSNAFLLEYRYQKTPTVAYRI